ncbi:MAG: FAD-dependent oxidoreductase [Myxococcales bacterium]
MADTTTTNEIHLTIDGKACIAKSGQTLLDAAKAAGVEIPTLCHDPRLPPYGACLLCVVEVERSPKLLLSCATEAKEGMVVETRSAKVVASRKQTLELLASNHYADCRGECYARCPASVDVQGYLALAYAGRNDDAVALVRERNPLPSVCGRVCVRYCEATCRRRTLDEPVGVNLVKRFVADAATMAPRIEKALPNGRKVAIVGGGPAGLTAAYFLAKRGYEVQILDAHPKLGGTLRYGIPDYRLPQDVLDKDIGHILDHGVKATANVRLGKDFTLDSLKADGYEAVLLALGAVKAKPMGVKGEATPGVVGGVDFLAQVKKQGAPELKGTVITVGGGNTAIDAARTALRCGASRSVIVYRRTREEMPADPGEIEDALAEGVTIEFLAAPLEVVSQDGTLHALRCQRMKLGDPDSSGRRKPVAIEGAVHDFPCNAIIAAIGQDVDLFGTKGAAAGDVATNKWNTVQVDPKTYATNLPGVFGAGDAATGPMAAVDAIGAGRKSALVIDHYLRTGQLLALPTEFISKKSNLADPHPDGFEGLPKIPRAEPRKDDPDLRATNWKEMDHGIDARQAHEESGRCLSCGCSAVFTCLLKRYCDEYAVDQTRLEGKVKKYKVDSRHPFIEFDPNKCVLCGKCVRLCADLIPVPALGFVHRGFDTMMRPSMERALQDTTCVSCGNCLETCPTGAIHARSPLDKPGPWRTTPAASVCSYCGVGCAVSFDKTDDRIWQVSLQAASGVGRGPALRARPLRAPVHLRDRAPGDGPPRPRVRAERRAARAGARCRRRGPEAGPRRVRAGCSGVPGLPAGEQRRARAGAHPGERGLRHAKPRELRRAVAGLGPRPPRRDARADRLDAAHPRGGAGGRGRGAQCRSRAGQPRPRVPPAPGDEPRGGALERQRHRDRLRRRHRLRAARSQAWNRRDAAARHRRRGGAAGRHRRADHRRPDREPRGVPREPAQGSLRGRGGLRSGGGQGPPPRRAPRRSTQERGLRLRPRLRGGPCRGRPGAGGQSPADDGPTRGGALRARPGSPLRQRPGLRRFGNPAGVRARDAGGRQGPRSPRHRALGRSHPRLVHLGREPMRGLGVGQRHRPGELRGRGGPGRHRDHARGGRRAARLGARGVGRQRDLDGAPGPGRAARAGAAGGGDRLRGARQAPRAAHGRGGGLEPAASAGVAGLLLCRL